MDPQEVKLRIRGLVEKSRLDVSDKMLEIRPPRQYCSFFLRFCDFLIF